MAKGKKNIRKIVGEKLAENSQGSMRRRGRSAMQVVDRMSTGRRRTAQSTDSNQ